MEKKSKKEVFEDYEGFVEKFKPKKTTDDCYTPPEVYEAVKEWVSDNIIRLADINVVRPFWPGADYRNIDYPEGCIVIDNPPFSILAEISRFFHKNGIRYFLFAPTLTLANSARELDRTFIIANVSIEYENGAKIATSFVTNLDCGGNGIWVSGSLTDKIDAVQQKMRLVRTRALPLYKYPECVVSPALLSKIAVKGVEFKVKKNECVNISSLSSQRAVKKSIYGGGWLISEKAAAEKAAAEKAAARDRLVWELSEEEQEIIRSLGK